MMPEGAAENYRSAVICNVLRLVVVVVVVWMGGGGVVVATAAAIAVAAACCLFLSSFFFFLRFVWPLLLSLGRLFQLLL